MVKVYDTKTPAKHSWEMSEAGFEELNSKYPDRYKIAEEPKLVKVEKKSPVVVERVIRVDAPKKRKGKS